MTKKNLDDLHAIAGRMFNDLNAIKEVGGNANTLDINKKLRKANMQLKETEHNLSESIKQCGQEAIKRAKAEAELVGNSNIVDILSRTVNMISMQNSSSPRMEVGLGAVVGSASGMESDRGTQQSGGLVQETGAAQ